MKNYFKWGFIGLFVIFVLLIISNNWVENVAKNKHFNNVNLVPETKVALLLGTGKYLKNGYENLYYVNRIKACVELWESGKIKFIIISGDNRRLDYNEPEMMMKDLIEAGIPSNKIFLDFAGLRTLDSVVRAREIFGQPSFIVVSQQFHNERAIFIAEKNGINAIGFNAENVSSQYGFKTTVREYFARVKVVLDLYLTHKKPKYLGEKIEIK